MTKWATIGYTDGLSFKLPDSSSHVDVHKVLDIACGSGGWVLQMARHYPDIQTTGVDLSIHMIQYARAQALVESLSNAKFRLMDVRQPLDFPDASFDFVNARFLVAALPPADWPALTRECLRVTRPGGIIRLTETEFGISNSPAYERLAALSAQALKVAGRSFSPGERNFGLLPLLKRFLRDAGYQCLQHFAYAIDFSAGTEAHERMYEDFKAALKLTLPFLVKCGLTTQEEAEVLYQQALTEMYSDDFCAIAFYLSVWGVKPQ